MFSAAIMIIACETRTGGTQLQDLNGHGNRLRRYVNKKTVHYGKHSRFIAQIKKKYLDKLHLLFKIFYECRSFITVNYVLAATF